MSGPEQRYSKKEDNQIKRETEINMSRVGTQVETVRTVSGLKTMDLSPMGEEETVNQRPCEAEITSPRPQEAPHKLGNMESNVKLLDVPDFQLDQSPHDLYCKAKELEYVNNTSESMSLFKQAAEDGHLSAMVSYALLLVSSDEGLAFEWLRMAADRGSGRAYYHLGQLFARGGVFDISPATAAKCWHRAAALCDSGGRSALGLCYIRGFGVKQDVNKGVAMVTQVAELHEDITAMKNLAWIYRHGKGVVKNEAEAASWWQRALLRDEDLKEAETNWQGWKISPI